MTYAEPVIPIPTEWQSRYRILRILLYISVISIVSIFTLRMLFPTLIFSFNFKTPSSSKNNLLDPRSPSDTPRTNGKIETNGTLVANAGVIGDFSQANVNVTLEKKSALPESLEFSLRRSYRSFFLPTGVPVTGFPEATIYKVDDVYYALQNGTLYPFISDSAYLTRYPESFALPADKDLLASYPVSESWLGFRIGSVVSFADGVFLITSDTEMRPIGSADIFLALGYRFEDVRQSSEEEIGIYKRGRIFLLGAQHPDGTLLFDQDTKTYYLVEQNMKRPLTDTNYLNFLVKQQTPIAVSKKSSEIQTRCTLEPSLLGQSFSCNASLAELRSTLGNDFEISITKGNADIDINTLEVSFVTNKNTQNMLTLLSQIKQRLLARVGLGNE